MNMRLSLGLWTALCGSFMAIMLSFAAGKTVVIADVSQDQQGLAVENGYTGHGGQGAALVLQPVYEAEGIFRIPLPQGTRPENVVIENRYMDRELWIYLQEENQDFYRENPISGDMSHVLEGYSVMWEEGLLLKLVMDEVMEYRSTLEGGALTIACNKPHDLYDFLVVLDPAGGGSDVGAVGSSLTEKELALEVARLVQRQFNLQNVRLYLTRTEDAEISQQDRTALAEAVGADLYIRIGAGADPENPEAYGIQGSYNEEYFIPGYGNAAFADTVTKAVTIAVSNRAVGLLPAGEDSILRNVKVTAMELSMGYLSNSQEEALLRQDFYQERLAAGIIEAVQEACSELEQLRK